MAREASLGLAIAIALVCLGCNKSSSTPATKNSKVAASLTREVMFRQGTLLNDPLPETTDPRATIMPLGPTVVVHPGDSSIMALEVDDPAQRPVEATLIQFGDEPSHVKVTPQEGEGSNDVVETEFDVGKTLCKGLCNSVFTVEVTEKVQLSDGKISSATKRDVVVDCRKDGDPTVCKGSQSGSGDNDNGTKLLCGDVTNGEIAFSGDPIVDAHLDAIRQLSKVAAKTETEVQGAIATIATKLGLDPKSSAADVTNALQMRIDGATAAGLMLLLGQPGCAVRLEQVSLALRICDPDGVASLDALQCIGTCEPAIDKADACMSATNGGCRGLLAGAACGGTCTGACESMLEVPAMCVGTCIGSCSGQCPDDGKGGCAGPCDGICTGKCRTTSSGMCSGNCTGRCDAPSTGTPSCDTPLRAYCSPEMNAMLACPGDCFGVATVDKGTEACRASAVGIARSFPRCEAPLVQLSFGFKPDATLAEQTAFATLVRDLNTPLAQLYDALGRISLLSSADMDLATATSGAITDEVASGLSADSKDAGLGCANGLLPEITSWLTDEQTTLDGLKTDSMQLVSALSLAK